MSGTKVFVLGSGTPTPTPERFGSAFAVEVEGETLMIDCGPSATGKLVKAGLWPTRVDTLFFTHHHFDHDVDYPCFLLTRWDQSVGAEDDLRVLGPAPTVQLTDRLIGPDGAFTHDWQARVNAPVSQRVFVNRGGILPRRPLRWTRGIFRPATWGSRSPEACSACRYEATSMGPGRRHRLVVVSSLCLGCPAPPGSIA